MKFIDVTCAIIRHKDCILATQRSADMDHPGKWEFPGGKVNPNEEKTACIIREIWEELKIQIEVEADLEPVEHHYDFRSVRLYPFICKATSLDIQLTEHAQYRWVPLEELISLDWVEADIPIAKEIQKRYL